MHAIIINGVPSEVSGSFTDATGVKHPASVLTLWSETELAAVDVYPITEPAVPQGQIATGSALEWDGETVTRVWTLEDYTPPVPASASPLQIRKALRQMGLKAAIDTFIAGQSEEVQEAWEYAVQIDRDNALIAAAAAELNKTPADIDDLFRLAVTL